MTSPTAITLTGFITWTLALLIMMEIIRAVLVVTNQVAANGFSPDNANLSPFMQRLARAHANCVEGLPVFGGLLVVALLMERTAVTDTLAYVFLAARVVQSCIHLASTSPAAVTARFTAFTVQMVIAVVWVVGLLSR